jgi:hypothetical protein
MKILFSVILLLSEVEARSGLTRAAKAAERDVQALMPIVLVIMTGVVAGYMALGSRDASERKLNLIKGSLMFFGGSALISMFKGWF